MKTFALSFAVSVLVACAPATSDPAETFESALDALPESHQAFGAILESEGYTRVATKVYRIPAGTEPGNFLCVGPSHPSGQSCAWRVGDNVDQDVPISRYEHADGRVAFVTSQRIFGPIRRGQYLSPGFGSRTAMLVDVREFELSPMVGAFVRADIVVPAIYERDGTVRCGDGPGKEIRPHGAYRISDLDMRALGFPESFGFSRTFDRYPGGSVQLDFDKKSGELVRGTYRMGLDSVSSERFEFTPTIENLGEALSRPAIRTGKFRLPKWDQSSRVCDPTKGIVVEIGKLSSSTTCTKYIVRSPSGPHECVEQMTRFSLGAIVRGGDLDAWTTSGPAPVWVDRPVTMAHLGAGLWRSESRSSSKSSTVDLTLDADGKPVRLDYGEAHFAGADRSGFAGWFGSHTVTDHPECAGEAVP